MTRSQIGINHRIKIFVQGKLDFQKLHFIMSFRRPSSPLSSDPKQQLGNPFSEIVSSSSWAFKRTGKLSGVVGEKLRRGIDNSVA